MPPKNYRGRNLDRCPRVRAQTITAFFAVCPHCGETAADLIDYAGVNLEKCAGCDGFFVVIYES